MPSKTEDSQDITQDPPTSIDPYEVLSISQDATEEDVKKAYRKAALKNHPDKTTDEDKIAAKEKFQEIAFAYAILSDPRRRKRYDATGSTAETLDFEDDDFNWLSFFQTQYENVITEDAIDKHKREYQGTEEEKDAVLDSFRRGKGNLDTIYSAIMHSNVIEDDERFRRIINEGIANGEVEAYDKYTKETEKTKAARKKNALRQAKEAEAEEKRIKQKKSKKDGVAAKEELSLAALIQQKQTGRETRFFEHLEEKYAQKGKGTKRKSAHMDEPPEEAFAANAARKKKARK